MADNVNVDLSNASETDLLKIKNEVLARLANRATGATIKADGYDRHGSGHSRSSPPTVFEKVSE
jgi:hypothetical protein